MTNINELPPVQQMTTADLVAEYNRTDLEASRGRKILRELRSRKVSVTFRDDDGILYIDAPALVCQGGKR